MPKKNIIYLILIVISLVFFYLGITYPMLELKMNAIIESNILSKNVELLNQSHSIVGTMSELWNANAKFAAILIFVFSLITPTLKVGLFIFCLIQKNNLLNKQLLRFISFISKWSFADVLVLAVLIAFLSAARNPETISEVAQVMGFKIPLKIQTPLQASFGVGFYFFTIFCLISNFCTSFYCYQESNKS